MGDQEEFSKARCHTTRFLKTSALSLIVIALCMSTAFAASRKGARDPRASVKGAGNPRQMSTTGKKSAPCKSGARGPRGKRGARPPTASAAGASASASAAAKDSKVDSFDAALRACGSAASSDEPLPCPTGKCEKLDLECQGVIQMKNGAMLHLGRTAQGKYKVVAKEHLKKLPTKTLSFASGARTITNGRIFTKKVLNVLQGRRSDQKITGWCVKGQPANLGKLEVNVEYCNQPFHAAKFNFRTLDEEKDGINAFLHQLNRCDGSGYSIVVTPQRQRRLIEKRPIHRLTTKSWTPTGSEL